MRQAFIFLLLAFGCSQLVAQNRIGINFKSYKAHGEFNQNIDHNPVGFSFNYLHQIRESHFTWGGELGIAMYSNDQYVYELDKEGYPGEFVQVDEEDCFWNLHAIGQYEFISNPDFKSYLELRVGITTFFSSRTVEEDPRYDGEFDFHGTAFNTGLGAGVLINPKGAFTTKEPGNMWINLGVNIHSGSNAYYRNAENGGRVYSLGDGIHRSLTSYTDFRLGMLFDLGEKKE